MNTTPEANTTTAPATAPVGQAPGEETMSKKNFQAVELIPVGKSGGMSLAISTFAEAEKFACMMAVSNFVPKHLRGKPADCLAVLLQSIRWDMDPFAVAQKTYFVNDGIGYEAQLINAIIIARAPLRDRPNISWSGEGEGLKCLVSATFIGESKPKEFEGELKTITTRNSPLWKQQPKQQIGYYTLRGWARLYCPDVIMGIYTPDEREGMVELNPQDRGPSTAAPRKSKLDQFADAGDAGTTTIDHETGEIFEQQKPAAEEKPAADKPAVMFEEPSQVPARVLPGNATATDWDSWTIEFIRKVSVMKDVAALEKLREINSNLLVSLQAINPPKHHSAMEAFTLRFNVLGGRP